MDASRFDRLTWLVVVPTSRRQTLAAIVVGALGVHELRADVEAGPGCRNVGAPCRSASQCCSNLCARVGKKRKIGKKPKKRCLAHDASTCLVGQDSCVDNVSCTTSLGQTFGGCYTTTGNAPYCSAEGFECIACQKDADCENPCGAGAACITCNQPSTCPGLTQVCIGLTRECDKL